MVILMATSYCPQCILFQHAEMQRPSWHILPQPPSSSCLYLLKLSWDHSLGLFVLFLQLDGGHLRCHFRDGSEVQRLCSCPAAPHTQRAQHARRTAAGAAVGNAGTRGQGTVTAPLSAGNSITGASKARVTGKAMAPQLHVQGSNGFFPDDLHSSMLLPPAVLVGQATHIHKARAFNLAPKASVCDSLTR